MSLLTIGLDKFSRLTHLGSVSVGCLSHPLDILGPYMVLWFYVLVVTNKTLNWDCPSHVFFSPFHIMGSVLI